MTAKRVKTKIPGIRYREHNTRKFGIQKDRYFFIVYQLNKKQKEEGVGWASEGWTEQKVNEILCELKANIRLGKHPQTLAEMRELDKKDQEEQKQESLETESERITLDEVFEMYLPVHKSATSGKTWKVTSGYYRNWIADKLGSKRLVDITVDDIREVVVGAMKTLAPRSAAYIKAVFRQIFNFAISRDLYLKKNPAMLVVLPAFDNKRTFFFSNEQMEELLKRLYARRKIIGDMVNLAFHTGCRASEIFNLKWENIDFKNKFLILLDTKHAKRTRYVPLDDTAFEILNTIYNKNSTGLVFKNNNNKAFKEMPDCYNKVLEEMGLRKEGMSRKELPVFHSARHTFASNLVINDVNLREVQTLMGHSTSSMTERYSHLAPKHLKQAISKLSYASEKTKTADDKVLKAKTIAKKMLQKGLSPLDVSEVTGLSVSEIEKLK